MLPSGLPEHIADEEPLARFLTSSSQFNTVMVKPSAFLPGPTDHKTSVFRHGNEPRDVLWQIAAVAIGAQRTVHGAALLAATVVRSIGLDVEAEEPPDRHANIARWPEHANDPELTRAWRKEHAAVLAQQSELVRR